MNKAVTGSCAILDSRGPLFRIVILAVISVKSVLAAITPLSFDFINIGYGALGVSQGIVFQGPYTFSVNLMNLFYRLWLLIPVDHSWIYSGHSFIPSSSSFLLLFMFKLPLLAFDLLTSLLIYKCVSLITMNRRWAAFGGLIWLLNPYLTLLVEMDGTTDVVSTFLVVLACYLFVCGRYVLSGIGLAVATIARFYPIALFPFFILILLKERNARNLTLTIASYSISLVLPLIPFVLMYGVNFLNTIYELPIGGNREFIWFLGFRPSVASTSGMEISSVVTVLAILALLILRVWKADRWLILDVVLVAFLVFLGFSHFNRYYTIWVVPFLTIKLAMNWSGSYRKVYAALFTLFFVSAFAYDFAYWWSSSFFFIYEFTPQISHMSMTIRMIGDFLRLRDLGTTFSQSILAGTCIIYATMAAMREIIRNQNQRGNVNCNPCKALMVVES